MPQTLKNTNFDYLFKAIVVGNSAVGKTNIILRLTDGNYNPKHMSTIGVDFKVKTIEVEDKKVKLQVWDTAGQCKFRNIVKTYFKGASGILFVYSVTDWESFRAVEDWIKQAEDTENPESQARILLANKVDVVKHQHQVTQEQGIRLAEKYQMKFFQVSAKESLNINEAFQQLAALMKDRCDKKRLKNIANSRGNNLNNIDHEESERKKCC